MTANVKSNKIEVKRHFFNAFCNNTIGANNAIVQQKDANKVLTAINGCDRQPRSEIRKIIYGEKNIASRKYRRISRRRKGNIFFYYFGYGLYSSTKNYGFFASPAYLSCLYSFAFIDICPSAFSFFLSHIYIFLFKSQTIRLTYQDFLSV